MAGAPAFSAARQAAAVIRQMVITRYILVEGECVHSVTGGDQDILVAVQHVSLRRVGNLAQMSVPENLSVRRIVSNQIAARIAGEQQFAGGSQHSVTYVTSGSRIAVFPRYFTGFVINSR